MNHNVTRLGLAPAVLLMKKSLSSVALPKNFAAKRFCGTTKSTELHLTALGKVPQTTTDRVPFLRVLLANSRAAEPESMGDPPAGAEHYFSFFYFECCITRLYKRVYGSMKSYIAISPIDPMRY